MVSKTRGKNTKNSMYTMKRYIIIWTKTKKVFNNKITSKSKLNRNKDVQPLCVISQFWFIYFDKVFQIRGHIEAESNIIQVLHLRANEKSEMRSWITARRVFLFFVFVSRNSEWTNSINWEICFDTLVR